MVHSGAAPATAADVHSRNQSGKRDSTGALDVVVEHGHLVLVLLHEAVGVGHAKVLELRSVWQFSGTYVNDRVGEEVAAVPDELVDELTRGVSECVYKLLMGAYS